MRFRHPKRAPRKRVPCGGIRSPEDLEADRRCLEAIREVFGLSPLYPKGEEREPLAVRDSRRFYRAPPVLAARTSARGSGY